MQREVLHADELCTEEQTLNNLLEKEAQELTQAARYERTESRQGYRSGHYNRNLITTSGEVTLKVLRLKNMPFETAIIERYRRRESKLIIISENKSVRWEEKMTKKEIDFKFIEMNHQHQHAIMEIFNYYIVNGTAAFPDSALPEKFYGMLLGKAKGYPAYALVNNHDCTVIGFCFLSAYNPLPSFRQTANISCFIAPGSVGQGLGRQCFKRLQDDAKALGIKYIIAEISAENDQSIEFHKKQGFYHCGILKHIGYKLNRDFSVVYMQKDLKDE